MPDFILLLHRRPGPPPLPEAMAAMIKQYGDWAGRLRGEGRLKAGAIRRWAIAFVRVRTTASWPISSAKV